MCNIFLKHEKSSFGHQHAHHNLLKGKIWTFYAPMKVKNYWWFLQIPLGEVCINTFEEKKKETFKAEKQKVFEVTSKSLTQRLCVQWLTGPQRSPSKSPCFGTKTILTFFISSSGVLHVLCVSRSSLVHVSTVLAYAHF